MDTQMDDTDDVQQALLDKLMQYGDSLLDTEDYEQRKASVSNKSKKKYKKNSQNEDKTDIIHTQSSGSVQESSQKVTKKKRKKSKQTEDTDEFSYEQEKIHKKKKKSLEDFVEELRTFKEERQNVVSGDECEREEENGSKSDGPEVIVFDDPSKRKKKKGKEESKEVNFDLDKARLEVLKFGYSGFDYNDRKKYEQERAIKLGAKAPKREYVNYKLLQQQLKQQRNYERNKREKDRQLGMPVKAKSDEEKNPQKTVLRNHGFWKDRSTEKGFHLDGQVGRYRPGVLWLNKQDIAKVRGKSKKSGNKTSKHQKNSNKMGGKPSKTGGKKK